MTQTTFALLTNKGRSKEAMALANGSDIVVTHIAIGDGTTVPSGGETKLYHEVDRKAITGHGLVTGTTNTAYFDIHLMAADGPYTIREAGLYDADEDLIAIAYYDPPIQKPTPDSGQTVEGDIRLEIAFSNVENIIVQVDTSMQVPLQRLTVCPWIPVKSITVTTPPTDPKVGDAYVIPDKATGVWKGQSQKIAEFTSAGWAITTTSDGHGIGLPDGSVFVKVDGQYQLLRLLYQNWFDLRYSRLTTPPADTFYVVGPSGSDQNTGLKPTAEEGFATIQGAIDTISRKYITQSTITLKISPGIYDGVSIDASFVSNWVLIGDETNPDAVKIIATDTRKTRVRGLTTGNATTVAVKGISFSGYYEALATTNGYLTVSDCNILLSGSSSTGIACYGGNLQIYGKINVSGSGNAFVVVDQGGFARLGYVDIKLRNATSINYNNATCNNFLVQNSSTLVITSPVVKFAGQPYGAAYICQFSSTIMTSGGGANFIPGTKTGWAATGGQVV